MSQVELSAGASLRSSWDKQADRVYSSPPGCKMIGLASCNLQYCGSNGQPQSSNPARRSLVCVRGPFSLLRDTSEQGCCDLRLATCDVHEACILHLWEVAVIAAHRPREAQRARLSLGWHELSCRGPISVVRLRNSCISSGGRWVTIVRKKASRVKRSPIGLEQPAEVLLLRSCFQFGCKTKVLRS